MLGAGNRRPRRDVARSEGLLWQGASKGSGFTRVGGWSAFFTRGEWHVGNNRGR
jgi:hypothetical protein